MGQREELVQMLLVTAEVCGTTLSKPAAIAMASELASQPLDAVATALRKCQRELTGRLTLAAILARLASADGRPGADEAWAIAGGALDEARTLVWTDDMEQAYGACREIHIAGDGIAARMAFREAYARIVADARDAGQPVRWNVSMGTDASTRGSAVLDAVELGRLSVGRARALIGPELPDWDRVDARLLKLEGKTRPALPANTDAADAIKRLTAKVGKAVH